MIYKEELKIVNMFRNKPFAEITLHEIMTKLGKKSYNWTYKAVQKLNSKGILKVRKIGKTLVCRYDFEDPAALTYLLYSERLTGYEKVPKDLISKILKSLSRCTPYFILIVGGSYAENRARKTSDLDLAVIVESKDIKKRIRPYLKDALQLAELKVDEHIFTKKEFREMLIRQEENFGKELARKHVILYGADIYYSIIMEAHQSGFQG